jgi:hypothetical protein
VTGLRLVLKSNTAVELVDESGGGGGASLKVILNGATAAIPAADKVVVKRAAASTKKEFLTVHLQGLRFLQGRNICNEIQAARESRRTQRPAGLLT